MLHQTSHKNHPLAVPQTILQVDLPLSLPTALLSMLLVVLLDLHCIHDQQDDIVTYWRNFGNYTRALRLRMVLDDHLRIWLCGSCR